MGEQENKERSPGPVAGRTAHPSRNTIYKHTREAPAPPVLTLPCYCQWDRRALVHVAGVGGCTPGEGDTSDATEAGDDL